MLKIIKCVQLITTADHRVSGCVTCGCHLPTRLLRLTAIMGSQLNKILDISESKTHLSSTMSRDYSCNKHFDVISVL